MVDTYAISVGMATDLRRPDSDTLGHRGIWIEDTVVKQGEKFYHLSIIIIIVTIIIVVIITTTIDKCIISKYIALT